MTHGIVLHVVIIIIIIIIIILEVWTLLLL